MLRGVRPMGLWSISNNLVDVVRAVDAGVGAGNFFSPVEVPRQRRVQNPVDERRFARPRRPGDAGQGAQGDVYVYVLEVVLSSAHNPYLLPVATAPRVGHGNCFITAQIGRRQRGFIRHKLFGRSGGDDVPAVDARAGTQIHDIVRPRASSPHRARPQSGCYPSRGGSTRSPASGPLSRG